MSPNKSLSLKNMVLILYFEILSFKWKIVAVPHVEIKDSSCLYSCSYMYQVFSMISAVDRHICCGFKSQPVNMVDRFFSTELLKESTEYTVLNTKKGKTNSYIYFANYSQIHSMPSTCRCTCTSTMATVYK